MSIEKEIYKIIYKELKEMGFTIDNITYFKEDNTNFLKIVIDKKPYVNVEDCVAATNVINPILDKTNLINDAYILDVCSKQKGSDL